MIGLLRTQDSPTKAEKPPIRWVATAVIAATLALSAWALSSPVGSSPDDDYHNVSIWCGQGLRDGLCEEGPSEDQVLVPQPVYSNAFCFAGQPDKSAECAQSSELTPTVRVNNLQNLYPDGYYFAMSWLASENVNQSIISMRIANSIFAVLAFSIVIVALPRHLRRVPLVAVLVSSVPLGFFVLASVNPSAWAIISVIIFFSSALGLMSDTSTKQRIVLAGMSILSVVVGFSSRPDAPAYLLLAGVLALVLNLSLKGLGKRTKLVILVACIAVFMFFVLRYVYPLFTTLRGIDFGVGQVDSTWQGVILNLVKLPDLFVGAFGLWGLGWIDTPTPSSVWAVTYGIYVAVVFSGMRFFDLRQSIASAISFFALVFVPIQFLWANNLPVGSIVQPRYLLPMLALLVAVSLFRKTGNLEETFSRGQVLVIGFGLFIANTISLHTNLRRYITGLDVNQVSLNFKMEWWWFERPSSGSIFWFSPNYLWAAGSVAFGVFLFSIFMLRNHLHLQGEPQVPDSLNTKDADSLLELRKKPITSFGSRLLNRKNQS